MSLGASKTEVLDSCPKEIEYYIKAYEMARKRRDEESWMFGIYVESAVSTAIEHNFAGRKAQSKYIDKPLLKDLADSKKMSNDELKRGRELFMAKLNLMKANFDLEKKKKEKEENAEH